MDKDILIVDDEEHFLRISQFYVGEKLGYSTQIAGSAAAAIKLLKTQKFAAIFTDLNMPDINGLMLAHIIRRDLELTQPIVVITGFLSEKVELLDAGVDAIIGKPIELRELKKCLTRVLNPELQLTKLPKSANKEQLSELIIDCALAKGLCELGRGGIYIDKEQVRNFASLEKGMLVRLDLRLEQKITLKGIGYVQWMRYDHSPFVKPGLGVEFVYLEDASREFFFEIANTMKTGPFIPIGRNEPTDRKN